MHFLSNLIPVEEIDKLNDKPTNERYRHFKVDEQPIIEPFVTIEHKDHRQLIKDNNIKPIKCRNGEEITINIKCPHCTRTLDHLISCEDFEVYVCRNQQCPYFLKIIRLP